MLPQVLLMKRMPDAVGGVARKVSLLQVLLTKRPPDAVGGVAKEVAVAHVQMHACLGASACCTLMVSLVDAPCTGWTARVGGRRWRQPWMC